MTVSLCQIEIVWVFSLPLMFTFSKSGFRWKNQRRRQDQSPFSFREQSTIKKMIYISMNNPSLVLVGHPTSSDMLFLLESNSISFLSTSSTGSDAESAPPEFTDLFHKISAECTRLVVQAGKQIPPQWDMPDLLRTVIADDEGMVVIPGFLTDAYYDIMLCGPHSWLFQDVLHWIDLVNYAPQV